MCNSRGIGSFPLTRKSVAKAMPYSCHLYHPLPELGREVNGTEPSTVHAVSHKPRRAGNKVDRDRRAPVRSPLFDVSLLSLPVPVLWMLQ